MVDVRLSKLLPYKNFVDDDQGHLSAFINQVLQPTLDIALSEANRWSQQNDPDVASEQSINAILGDLGNPYRVALDQPLNRRRLLIRSMVKLYKSLGTDGSIINAVRALSGVEIQQVVSPSTGIIGMKLGVQVLAKDSTSPPVINPLTSDTAFLGPGARFSIYSFDVQIASTLTTSQKTTIREIINLTKPAHTHFVRFIEPTTPPVIDHWQLGSSRIYQAGKPILGDEAKIHGP